jgi:hypothetical protein
VTTIGDIIYEELPAFARRTGKETLRVLEVGVLRNLDQEHLAGDGHSTLAFARLLKDLPGSELVVVYLDCDNSGSTTMKEYLLAVEMLDRPGLVMGDDMNTDHPDVRKGRVLIPYLSENRIPFRLRKRHTPWDTRDILVQEVA